MMTSAPFAAQTPASETLKGVATALVTPMRPGGGLDASSLDRLIDSQLAAGIQGLVALGTTAEAATLTPQERRVVMRQIIRRVDGKVPVTVGTGGQGTQTTIEAQQEALDEGAACGLVVTPFYNKPTQAGLLTHFETVAEQGGLPVMLYNVPSRTACDLRPETVVRLAAHPNIVGIKEATGDLSRLDVLLEKTPADFVRLSGDDATSCAFCLMGGDGVISVTSNVAPADMLAMVALARQGETEKARSVHRRLAPLIDALFTESNPIPIKAALCFQKGIADEALRLPLTALASHLREPLREALVRATPR